LESGFLRRSLTLHKIRTRFWICVGSRNPDVAALRTDAPREPQARWLHPDGGRRVRAVQTAERRAFYRAWGMP